MYKEWMNKKRTNNNSRLKNDNDKRLWVRLLDGKSEQEVEPINLVFDETDKFNEVVKKYILNDMREHNQCFITIMAYNLMWTHDGKFKILNLTTDDRLGHLRIVRRKHIDDWLKDYLEWYRNAMKEQETEGSCFVYIGWICFHVEMFPLLTYVGHKHPTPFFIGYAILDMSKNIIYDFYYNVLKNTCDKVELLGQDTDSLIVQLNDNGNVVHKMCDMYKLFDFLKMDNTSYFYGQLVKYYEQEVDNSKFPSLKSFFNFNKSCRVHFEGQTQRTSHHGVRRTETVDILSG